MNTCWVINKHSDGGDVHSLRRRALTSLARQLDSTTLKDLVSDLVFIRDWQIDCLSHAGRVALQRTPTVRVLSSADILDATRSRLIKHSLNQHWQHGASVLIEMPRRWQMNDHTCKWPDKFTVCITGVARFVAFVWSYWCNLWTNCWDLLAERCVHCHTKHFSHFRTRLKTAAWVKQLEGIIHIIWTSKKFFVQQSVSFVSFEVNMWLWFNQVNYWFLMGLVWILQSAFHWNGLAPILYQHYDVGWLLRLSEFWYFLILTFSFDHSVWLTGLMI